MKLFYFFALIFALLAPAFSAATINERSANNLIAREGGSAGDKLNDVVSSIQSNGLRKLDFYHNGQLEGSAIETEEGGVIFLDVNGEEVDLTSDLNLAARQSRFQLAIKFAKLIARWGKRAWDYIYCVGASGMWRCGDDYVNCATQGTPPWLCVEGIVCVGVAARGC